MEKTTHISNGFKSHNWSGVLAWHATNRDGFHPVVLYQPNGVAFIGDDVTVAEGFWPYSRIQVFGGESGKSLRASNQNEILPFGLTVVGDSSEASRVIAVTDHKDRTVKFVSGDTRTLIASWPSGMFDWPTGLAVDDKNTVYVSDWFRGMIYVCDWQGRVVTSFNTAATAGESTRPFYVAVDSNRRIIVSDAYKHCVSVFDQTGRLVRKITGADDQAGGVLDDPRGVCVDGRDNIIVADWAASVVRKYSPEGLWICNLLNASDDISYPWDVSMDLVSGNIALTENKLGERSSLKLFKKPSDSDHYM